MKYVLSGIGIMFGLFFVLMLLTVGFVSTVNRSKGDRGQVLPGEGENARKAIIIYQPAATKATTKVAQQLAAGLNAGGYEVTLNHPGEHLSPDLSGYGLIIFGSPTYAGQLTKTLTDYVVQVCSQLRAAMGETPRLALFATGAVDQLEEFDRLAETLNGLNVVKKVKFLSGAKETNEKTAYDLGLELAQK